MLNLEIIDVLRQNKLAALVAGYLHEKRIHRLRRKNLLVEFLTIAVPAGYAIPRFLMKGTSGAALVEYAWELFAAALLMLAILRVVYKWQDRETRHSIMLRKNVDVSREADQLLTRKTINHEVLEQFLKRIADIDMEDKELLADVTKEEDQEAAREGLKHLVPGATTLCSKCGADPWTFTEGACDACGGTPVTETKRGMVFLANVR
jgi:mobilome CxxCx(11)CxxC protein